MARKVQHSGLSNAKANKKDEFYTQLTDIERELKHYKQQFKGKVVLCNCDDPRVSNFFHFFSYNFEKFGLKKLIATCYKSQDMDLFSENKSEQAIYLEYEGDKNGDNIPNPEEIGIKNLRGDGDFRSKECVELLKEADIVVTNPPFSLFREYVSQIVEHNKKFLIVGNINAITYKEIFKLIKENKSWLGVNMGRGISGFIVPKHYELYGTEARIDENGNRIVATNNCLWLTNLDNSKRHEDIILYKSYSAEEFPTYDNYDAINVNKTKDIPMDYAGVMGVPITFLDKYNPEQFEILGLSASAGYSEEIVGIPFLGEKDARPLLGGKNTYARIFIKNKRL
ncbi:adenine-specific methyltransferase EcoRI family protein [Flavobacterium sp.]|uniref:adenine-specific methyltransferase EcoRI family protein n=1 Tax=Flavobacterium sp. TaxID=239 RepID=UPI0026069F2C|nr:adenine-specific methyltransferase EcoRI family protein [Flavobacterium sp.]